MPKAKDKNPTLEALREACGDERKAVEFMESRRWKGEPWCPYCFGKDVYMMRDRKTGERNKDHRWRCRTCNKQFSVRTGTVMEESRLPVRVWCYAFWKACASKKGVSALQISRECEVSYKSALFLMHRIRHAMSADQPGPRQLKGDVEVDETYVGGKIRYRKSGQQGNKDNKAVVFGAVERGGELRLRHPKRIAARELHAAVCTCTSTSSSSGTTTARLMTVNVRKPQSVLVSGNGFATRITLCARAHD